MKGDIKISKNMALLLTGTISLFAVADFVTAVDVKNAGGINIVGTTEEELSEAISAAKLEMNPVGSVVFRMDNVNPSSIYGGTWELITGDASIRFGDGTARSGTVEGSGNTKNVPLKNHSHTRGTMDITGQFRIGQSLSIRSNGTTGAFYSGSYETSDRHGGGATSGNGVTYFKASRNWTGSTSTVGDGTTPTMDVRGNYIKINVWKRTS